MVLQPSGALPVARVYAAGMGEAVANRTINRKTERYSAPTKVSTNLPRRDDQSLDKQVENWAAGEGFLIYGYEVIAGDDETVQVEVTVVGERGVERWEDVAERVSRGNAMLAPEADQQFEYNRMHHHVRQASLLMSGRHLQHGDADQINRNLEIVSNCSTAAASFISFYLLLNGSGVGRSYDDAMMAVDWSQAPITVPVIDAGHPDVLKGEITALDRRSAQHLYGSRDIVIFEVPDSREGWAQAIEKMETMAYEGIHRETVLLLDFSQVREKGAPIKGMQNRPASGPGPLMDAIVQMSHVRDAGMDPWKQAMYVDHYSAECVLVGGARRAARIATKDWRDPGILEFIFIKRPLEFLGKTGEEIAELRENGHYNSFLWTANNSVMVDAEFWRLVRMTEQDLAGASSADQFMAVHAKEVFEAVTLASYYDATGEPGLINQDRLVENSAGMEIYDELDLFGSKKYTLSEAGKGLAEELIERFKACDFKMIVNPCGEITIVKVGGYCLIGDVVPYHAQNDDDAEEAFRVCTRALIRTNMMDSLYGAEVKRTNRIGVGMTGLHEYAWSRFGYGFRDLIDEAKSQDFWQMLSRFKRAVVDEARTYSARLGVNVPHTDTTAKPAGTTSKLFCLTEGMHLAAMREFVRWVQYRNDDPLVEDLRKQGYPVRELKIYSGTTIVGFPTQPEICKLGMGDKLVTAAEATPEEQYQWLRLLEKYWIRGVEEDGVTPLPDTGNQLSYTLKYDPAKVSFEEFQRTLLEGQSTIRCCSVMPQISTSSYEYQPEEPTDRRTYEAICQQIEAASTGEKVMEDVGLEHVDCAGGACPVSFGENEASQG